jgi:hypothetical protein
MVLLTLAGLAFFPMVTIDTDPENMLEKNEPARVFHNLTKKTFDLSDIVVVGIINEHNPNGVFNPATLGRIYELTEFAKTLRWPDEKQPDGSGGVIEVDMIAPSLIDHMSQAGPGTIRFEWLMPHPPRTGEEALIIRERALSNPLLKGHMLSEDGKALCLYLPLTDKLLSYRVYSELRRKIEQLGGDEAYHITGLPVAEGAIGVEMFTQMEVASPLAMAVIFALLLLFFRKWRLIILPMIIATVSIITTMGLMIAFGFPVHILSSMLPIFLMSIAMVDSVHVLSEFFDVYTPAKGRRETIKKVMNTLFAPMLYTSLTTAAGFLSLTLAPIPPARVFGGFLCIGVMIAWLTTIMFVPAYVMMIPERKLKDFGLSVLHKKQGNWLTRSLRAIGSLTVNHAKPLLGVLLVVVVAAIWGITQIRVNDNYAKRFTTSHPLRQADIALNKHFGGTYTAYLVLECPEKRRLGPQDLQKLQNDLNRYARQIAGEWPQAPSLAGRLSREMPALAAQNDTFENFLNTLIGHIDDTAMHAPDETYDTWQELRSFMGVEKEKLKLFKQPEMLEYMAALQDYMEQSGLVGKCTSVADVVRKVHQELIDGRTVNFRIPATLQGVAECYLQYQQSHRPNDLWHLVTPDYRHANIRMQFRSGDSMRTKAVVKMVDDYLKNHTPPETLTCRWAGLHYINLVLEGKLVWGFLRSFAGSFLIVFVMMSVLFRSPLWGLLCMLPLSITLLVIYGLTGIIGKDYDLPIAVLSALSIGMAVDFAIHFLERSRMAHRQEGSWRKAAPGMFREPARAISRNVLVIAIGFLPLLVAPLVPYKTTGVMLFAILSVSGLITLLALPAVLTTAEKWFFKKAADTVRLPGMNSATSASNPKGKTRKDKQLIRKTTSLTLLLSGIFVMLTLFMWGLPAMSHIFRIGDSAVSPRGSGPPFTSRPVCYFSSLHLSIFITTGSRLWPI